MRVAILGFGLIGGSIARALHLRETGRWQVAAWSPSGEGPRRAAAGSIARAAMSVEAAVADAELVVLAAPPLEALALLDRLADGANAATATVTDVVSTKRAMVERAAELGLPFVGGHPMAGLETSGYEAATPDLFVDRPWVTVGQPGTDLERVEALARAVGARPVAMSAEAHDAAVAAISHLPLVVAAAIVEAVTGDGQSDWPVARSLAAGGWRDMTRLARGDSAMGAGIAATNAELIAARLRDLRDVLDEWLAELEGGDPDPVRLEQRFAAARAALGTGE
jgi:prephenate dehydrogenase